MPEASNLRTIYQIKGAIPCDNQMRGLLDPLDPRHLRPLLRPFFLRLQQAGVIRDYHYWQKFVIVSVDGVEHFSSTTVHCPHCTTRTHRDGAVSYHHAGLAAVLIHPAQTEVFPLDFEPIRNEDGAQKNDCERNAAKRLCAALSEQYPDLQLLLVEDALDANAPHLRQITAYGWKYVLNVKPDSHASLFKQFAGRLARSDVQELRQTTPDGVQHYYRWTKNLCLCESATDVKVNFRLYEQTTPDGEVTRWTWITNLPLQARTVERVMRAGRSRWKIENETFNTLKNQGYHFEHNYGHGQEKQDCEINAGKRLARRLREEHRQMKICVTGDDLYAHEPFIAELRALRMGFVLVAKPTSHAELFEWVKDLDRLGECVKGSWEEGPVCKRRDFEYRIAHQVPLTQSGKVLLNFVEVWERNKEGKVIYHNSWVTDCSVTGEQAATIIGIGRSRWKIENEQFNVHKNHGYELEHNYGHGQQTLSMVFYLLNLLAFLAHKVLEFGDRLYQQCRAGESRRGLWTLLRSAFYYVAVESWEALLRYHLSDEARGP